MIRVDIGHPAKGYEVIGKFSILACFARKDFKFETTNQPFSYVLLSIGTLGVCGLSDLGDW